MLLCERRCSVKSRTSVCMGWTPPTDPEAPHAWTACRNAPLLCDSSKVKPLLTIEQFSGFPQRNNSAYLSIFTPMCWTWTSTMITMRCHWNWKESPRTHSPWKTRKKATSETCDKGSTCSDTGLLFYYPAHQWMRDKSRSITAQTQSRPELDSKCDPHQWALLLPHRMGY